MIVTTGHQPELLAAFGRALTERGAPFRIVDASSDQGLADATFAHEPSQIVVFDHVFGLREPLPNPSGKLLDAALDAAQTHVRPKLVWVTSKRSDQDPSLQKIRKSGVPYIIVHAGRLVRTGQLGRAADVIGSTVLVARDLEVPEEGLCTVRSLGDGVAGAALEEQNIGRTLTLGFSDEHAWSELVRTLGAKPKTVPKFWVQCARWIGLPVVDSVTLRGESSKTPSDRSKFERTPILPRFEATNVQKGT